MYYKISFSIRIAIDTLLGLPNTTVFSYASELDFIILKLQLIGDGINCSNVRIQVWRRGMREGIARSQEWAEIASRKKVIAERD